ncbi:acyltransferase [Streptomyces sp. Je 1-79]|uniref:acyltransferase family protein n=1 Tax=Streptomyces sp. Je 1-79 TaxID=2943847 RepID=UPI0021A5AA48|nr:acyltransferase [Streptomyces sp. Je 1-79]MCT4356194.1 acyltransferase [Streptomyces sp. Je 1-79]
MSTTMTSRVNEATATRRLPSLASLTGLRFVAAMAVFLSHLFNPLFTPFGGAGARQADSLFTIAGGLGVTFFFVLSGFVLTWSVRPDDTPRRFVRRRLVKLYPNHLVTFALAMALWAAAAASDGWQYWLPNLLLLQVWFPDPAVGFSVNAASWSLGCELFFYLCFPLLHRVVGRIDPARLWAWAAGLAAAVIAVPAVATTVLPDGPPIPGLPVGEVQNWFVYQFPPVRMLEFVMGMVLARMVLTDRWIRLGTSQALLVCAAAYAVALHVPYLYSLNATWVIPVGLLVPAVARADLLGRRSPFRGRVMTWLGEVSFAFYLLQAAVLGIGVVLLEGHGPLGLGAGLVYCLAAWAVTLTLAHALSTYVERPAMTYWSRPRPAGPGSTGPRSAAPRSAGRR